MTPRSHGTAPFSWTYEQWRWQVSQVPNGPWLWYVGTGPDLVPRDIPVDAVRLVLWSDDPRRRGTDCNSFMPRASMHPTALCTAPHPDVGLLLKANRVGHTNRTIALCTDLIDMLTTFTADGDGPRPKVAGLVQKADALAASLDTRRHFVDSKSFDPRFLVFEFTWNILLRKNQVCLVCPSLCRSRAASVRSRFPATLSQSPAKLRADATIPQPQPDCSHDLGRNNSYNHDHSHSQSTLTAITTTTTRVWLFCCVVVLG